MGDKMEYEGRSVQRGMGAGRGDRGLRVGVGGYLQRGVLALLLSPRPHSGEST